MDKSSYLRVDEKPHKYVPTEHGPSNNVVAVVLKRRELFFIERGLNVTYNRTSPSLSPGMYP